MLARGAARGRGDGRARRRQTEQQGLFWGWADGAHLAQPRRATFIVHPHRLWDCRLDSFISSLTSQSQRRGTACGEEGGGNSTERTAGEESRVRQGRWIATPGAWGCLSTFAEELLLGQDKAGGCLSANSCLGPELKKELPAARGLILSWQRASPMFSLPPSNLWGWQLLITIMRGDSHMARGGWLSWAENPEGHNELQRQDSETPAPHFLSLFPCFFSLLPPSAVPQKQKMLQKKKRKHHSSN